MARPSLDELNLEIPLIVAILIFISSLNFVLSCIKKRFITLGLNVHVIQRVPTFLYICTRCSLFLTLTGILYKHSHCLITEGSPWAVANKIIVFELRHEKTNILHMRKQRLRSALW